MHYFLNIPALIKAEEKYFSSIDFVDLKQYCRTNKIFIIPNESAVPKIRNK